MDIRLASPLQRQGRSRGSEVPLRPESIASKFSSLVSWGTGLAPPHSYRREGPERDIRPVRQAIGRSPQRVHLSTGGLGYAPRQAMLLTHFRCSPPRDPQVAPPGEDDGIRKLAFHL